MYKLFHQSYSLFCKIFQRFNNTRKNPEISPIPRIHQFFKHQLAVSKRLQLWICTSYEFVPYINFEHFSVIYMLVPITSILEFICLISNNTKVAMEIKLFSVFLLTEH